MVDDEGYLLLLTACLAAVLGAAWVRRRSARLQQAATSTSRRRRDRLAAIALSVTSAALTLGLIEMTLRWVAWRQDVRAIAALAAGARPEIRPGARVQLHEVLLPSSHPEQVFKLRDGLQEVLFCRARFSTNNRGFRGQADVKPPKPPGVVRIVGIGDSIMFGWGVNTGESYLPKLREALTERFPSRTWEVVNTAVPGYNASMAVATLEHAALDLAPDVVIYGYCINDLELPRFLQTRENHLRSSRSYLKAFALGRRLVGAESGETELLRLYRVDRHLRSATDPAVVPPEYRGMVGMAGFERALDRLEVLSQSASFRVIVLAHPPVLPEHDAVIRRRGLDVVYTQPHIDRYLQEHGLDNLEDSPLIVGQPCSGSGVDLHPSAEGHQLIARALLEGGYWGPATWGASHLIANPRFP